MNQTPTTPINPDSHIDDIRELLVEFGLPVFVIIILTILLACGIDGEVKSAFMLCIGWIVKSGISHRRKK